MKAIEMLCQAALEQAVMAAESPPHSLATRAAYSAVSKEMIRQAVVAAVEAGTPAETITRAVAEALVAARNVRRIA